VATAEIHSIQTVSGNQARMRRIIEEATQTFLSGTPVSLAADGGLQAWVQGATKIVGFVKEAANNLAATGVIPTASVPGAQPSSGSVPFETSAVSITRPFFRDGRLAVEIAGPDTVFLGQVGPAQSVTGANIGVTYNLTKDADNHWFVDTGNTTNLVATLIKIDPNDQSASPRGVYFIITQAFWALTA
jgi:hypothetical protein